MLIDVSRKSHVHGEKQSNILPIIYAIQFLMAGGIPENGEEGMKLVALFN